MGTHRPSVFIGSSVEGVKIAKALQVNLDRACETVIWSQGVFGLSSGTLEELTTQAGNFDFAILVVTGDDLTTSREVTQPSPRDNVIFEAGLFMGVLGRLRTFLVYDRKAKAKIPSDLAGITLADYELHTSGNIQASVGAACTRIEDAITTQGPRDREGLKADITTNTQFQIISDTLDVSIHQFLILMHEQNTPLRREGRFDSGIPYAYALANKSSGRGWFSVGKMCDLLPEAGFLLPDLRSYITLTDRGREFAKWLVGRGRKADYFQSAVGSWGTAPEGMAPDNSWSYEGVIREQHELIGQFNNHLAPQPASPTTAKHTTSKKGKKRNNRTKK